MIDDDEKLISLLQDYFARFQLQLIGATHPEKGLQLLKEKSPAAVILDVMMPGQDGFAVCQAIRKTSSVPIIMLSARGETVDRIMGLELGADDYLPKPFEPRELVTRIQAVLRRSNHLKSEHVLKFDDLEIQIEAREVFLKGQRLSLSSMEYELLLLLVSKPGHKFSRDEIMNHLQGLDSDVFSRSIDVLISRLRAKLEDDSKQPRFIQSIRGVGYVFKGAPK